jgi:hypothetical protein
MFGIHALLVLQGGRYSKHNICDQVWYLDIPINVYLSTYSPILYRGRYIEVGLKVKTSGNSTLNTPVLNRSLKLSSVVRGWYPDG